MFFRWKWRRIVSRCLLAAVGLALFFLGFGAKTWLARPKELTMLKVPTTVLSKVECSVSGVYPDQGSVFFDLYNGSDWEITKAVFELTTDSTKRTYTVDVFTGPLSNGIVDISLDEGFLSEWSGEGRDLDPEALSRCRRWRIVSATGIPDASEEK